MRRAALAILLASASPALAADDYIDDRSGPASLVRSLYNAIDRGEFARAYSYFATPPAADLETYAQGYATTERVDLTVGVPSEEGAAGSVYYRLPVVITAFEQGGSHAVFAGCYTLRMANPGMQTETFEPLKIESGDLQPVAEGTEPALPTSCGDGPPLPEHDAMLHKAKTAFRADFSEICASSGTDLQPETYAFGFRYSFEGPDDPERQVSLYRFKCTQGAYNQTHVHYLANDEGQIEQIQFAVPEIDVRYANEGDNSVVDGVTMIGAKARAQITNSEFDSDTLTMSEHSLWRGVGDAFDAARWVFRGGSFNLVYYEVDAAYDGKMSPEVLVDYDFAP
ncbi:DUF1176 domain-containing protein [Mesorhizobium sp. CAU 1732]|uniref:DUF1176 domain-containing protein n=1 Tax=Mesorhizobium sp. CAU 1732 TaxID=3140358 RepID=UPI003260EA70